VAIIKEFIVGVDAWCYTRGPLTLMALLLTGYTDHETSRYEKGPFQVR